MDQIEIERMSVEEGASLLEGKRLLLEAECLREAALKKRIADLRPAVAAEREASGLDEFGRDTGRRVVRRTRGLDRLENDLGDCLREAQLAADRERGLAAEVGTLEIEFGPLVGWWREDPEGYPAKLEAEVEAAFAEVRDSRDRAQAEHEESERRAFDVGEGADIQTRLNAERDRAYRAAVLAPPQEWMHYAPALERIAQEKGRRLGRMVQARLWREQLMPQGMGVIA